MAKKERIVLTFVKKAKGDQSILFAVVGMPERTVAPAETAHYILFSGNKCKRYKMKINTVTYATNVDGDIVTKDRTKIANATPNFVEVKGQELQTMYDKCSTTFKRMFKLQ